MKDMKEYIVKVYEDHTEWYNKEGKLYREDGPAVEWAGGDKSWYINGKLHREDGPAREWVNGAKEWYLNGVRHHEDGPAIEWSDGAKAWYINGKLHREDGPAYEWASAKEWWLNGEQLTEEQFNTRAQVVEMTMDQVCKALGKNIKIIKGEN